MTSISIVISAFNENLRIEPTLRKIIRYMGNQETEYEILVIDDGSTDGTSKVAQSLKDRHIKIFHNSKNMGKGYSFKKGFLNSSMEYVLLTDADNGIPIGELKNFILHSRDYDIVIGSRSNNLEIYKPVLRRISSKIYNLLVRMFIVDVTEDSLCAFKLFNRKKCTDLVRMQKTSGFSFDVELLLLARRYNLKIKVLPVRWTHSMQSKVNLLKHPLLEIINLIRIKYDDIRWLIFHQDDLL